MMLRCLERKRLRHRRVLPTSLVFECVGQTRKLSSNELVDRRREICRVETEDLEVCSR